MKLILYFVMFLGVTTFSYGQEVSLPNKPIKLVVGFPPGGTTDAAARLIATKLGQIWHRTVIIENRAGASGMVAALAVAKSAADGSTLLVAPQTTMILAPAIYKSASFDTLKDFVPITMLGITPQVLVVNPTQSIGSVSEFVAHAKAHPGEMTYGSGGNGSTPHVAGALMAYQFGIDMSHVPYKGESLAVSDVLGGQVNSIFSNISVVYPFIQSHKLKALAVTSLTRSPLLPNVPTIAESGAPGFDSATWQGIFGPAGLPPVLADRIATDVRSVLLDPTIAATLASQGTTTVANRPSEFRKQLELEMPKWSKVIKQAGITPD